MWGGTAQRLKPAVGSVGVKYRVDANDRYAFNETLCNEQPIEWIAMVVRKGCYVQRVCHGDW